MRRLLAFLDPLLGRAPLIIEPYYRPAGQAQVRDDKPDSRKQLPEVELQLRHYSPRHLPTGRLVEKALVPDHWLVARSSRGSRQQLRNVPLQVLVGWYADGVLDAPLLQRLIYLRLGEGGVCSKHHVLAQLLLALNLRQQQLIPVFGAVHVARTQLRRQAV